MPGPQGPFEVDMTAASWMVLPMNSGMKVTDESPDRAVVVQDTSAALAAEALTRRTGLLAFKFALRSARDAGARIRTSAANAALAVRT
jgi:hypothetical protein